MFFVHHSQRAKQCLDNLDFWPEVEWNHTRNHIEIEGLYVFGGMLSDGSAQNELYILELGKCCLEWQRGSEICKGKPPAARFDHTVNKVRQ